MANDKFYGYNPKYKKPSGKEGTIYSGAEEGNTYEHLGNELDRVNPYEFRKGMDYELTAIGCMRLAESTPEEREKATESVLKNLEQTPNHYTSLITYETLFRNVQGTKPTFKAWLNKQQDESQMKEVKVGDKSTKHKEDKMKELKEGIKNKIKKILKEQGGAKAAAMADIEDEEGTPADMKKVKEKEKAKKKLKKIDL